MDEGGSWPATGGWSCRPVFVFFSPFTGYVAYQGPWLTLLDLWSARKTLGNDLEFYDVHIFCIANNICLLVYGM